MKRRRIKWWAEEDVHTGWRHYMTYYTKAGRAKAVKRRTNRRERREGKRDIDKGTW
jgi:hypothetical protein